MEIHVTHAKGIFSKLNGAKYFSTLNLCAGYHHIPFNEDSIPKTAFASPFGKYECLKVTFWTGTGTSILLRTNEKSIKALTLCYYLPR